MGQIGDKPRRVEVIPVTKPVRRPAPEPVREPVKEPQPAR
jgi:hypothetical protein